jgi:type III pantothenate kinase
MLLVADIGNTKILLGLYAEDRLVGTWRIPTDRNQPAGIESAITLWLKQIGIACDDIHGVALSCVTPGIIDLFKELAETLFSCQPLVVTGETPTPLQMSYGTPNTLGADRLLNCVAAVAAYGAPVIVVDLGTATTIDCVNSQREFLGGAIAPGVGTALQALLLAAPGLPQVELAAPERLIGRNTTECMQIGLVHYAAMAIDALVQQMQAEMNATATVVATGGLAYIMRSLSKEIHFYNDHLLLEGLRLVSNFNNIHHR